MDINSANNHSISPHVTWCEEQINHIKQIDMFEMADACKEGSRWEMSKLFSISKLLCLAPTFLWQYL